MASIKNLKKDINYTLGDIIDYTLDVSILKNEIEKGNTIIDEAIETFDSLIAKVHAKGVENKKAHYKAVGAELETKANALIAKVNSL